MLSPLKNWKNKIEKWLIKLTNLQVNYLANCIGVKELDTGLSLPVCFIYFIFIFRIL